MRSKPDSHMGRVAGCEWRRRTEAINMHDEYEAHDAQERALFRAGWETLDVSA